MEATYTASPYDFVHTITSNHKSYLTSNSSTSSSSHHLGSLDRDSAIALGVLLMLILLAISWLARSHIKQRRARRDLEQATPADSRMGILQSRIFRVDRKHSSQPSETERRQFFQNGIHEDGRAPVATLPRYEPRRMSRLTGLSQKDRERRWWGSVAAHGSTAQADRDEDQLPPLPPSPTLSLLSCNDNVSRAIYRPRSWAFAQNTPRDCSIVRRDSMPSA